MNGAEQKRGTIMTASCRAGDCTACRNKYGTCECKCHQQRVDVVPDFLLRLERKRRTRMEDPAR